MTTSDLYRDIWTDKTRVIIQWWRSSINCVSRWSLFSRFHTFNTTDRESDIKTVWSVTDPGGCGGCGRIPLSSDKICWTSIFCTLWRNGGSEPDAVWRHRSDGYWHEAGSAVWGSVHGKGYGTFGGEFRASHCNQWGLYGVRVHFRSDAALFPNYFGLVVTGNGDDSANDFNKYKMLRNL